MKENIRKFGKKIIEEKEKEGKNLKAIIADGTGFGYTKAYYLKEKRGEKLRKVSLHVKTEVIVVVMQGKKKKKKEGDYISSGCG